MSKKKTVQILNEKETIIDSVDITGKKLVKFQAFKNFISSKFNIKNKKLEYFIINENGNKVLINSEKEYKNYKNYNLYKVKIIDPKDQKDKDVAINKFNSNSIEENESINNGKESLKCWFCLKNYTIRKPFFCPNPNCFKAIHEKCLKKLKEKSEKIRCICGNEFLINDYKSNKNFNSITETPLESYDEKNNIKNKIEGKQRKYELNKSKCQKHPKENMIHFCFDCNRELCETCILNELTLHKNHRLIKLEQYNEIKKAITENENKLKDLDNIINEFELIIYSLNKNKNKFLEILQTISDNIKNEYDKYINDLNEKKVHIKMKYYYALNYKEKQNKFFDSLDKINYNELKNINEIKKSFALIINENQLKTDFINLMDYINNIKEMDNNNYNNFQKIIDNQNIFRTKIVTDNEENKYIGELKENLKTGKGILYLNNGSKYEGEFENNKYSGKGVLYYVNGDIYDGEFKDGKMEGKGIKYFKNGDKKEGVFKNNNMEGIGIYHFKNGDISVGNYKGNKEIGQHIYFRKNGSYEVIYY